MATNLKQYFPMIRERGEIQQLIDADEQKKSLFDSWNKEQQEEFLDMCCGAKGIKILYDAFFKEIMNPEYAPERLNEFLSLLLSMQVKICSVLPNDSTRITDEASLLITDIVVELEDASLATVEVQQGGDMVPGERSACYSADLLLRQYRRIRSQENKKFSYRQIKSVYTIVLFERSPQEFHAFYDTVRHFFEQKSDTGLELELLQKYIFIPLDIFRKTLQNKYIGTKLEAWLTFLCEDDPEIIAKLLETWPEFKPMYEEIYNLCRNIQGVMDMFSKELLELDRNTVQYMIDVMQETIDRQAKELEEMRLEKQAAELAAQQEKLVAEQEKQAAQQRIAELEALLKER